MYPAVPALTMTGKTHIACGACAAVLILRPAIPMDLALVFAMSAVGAVMPDIDIRNSICRRTIFPISISIPVLIFAAMHLPSLSEGLPGWTGTFWLWTLAMAALCVIGRVSPHRTFTHSLTAGALFTGSLYKALLAAQMEKGALLAAAAFAVGYMAHLVLDLTGFKKMQLLFPFGPWFSLKLFKASGKTDSLIRILSACVCLCTVLMQNKDMLIKGLDALHLWVYGLMATF